MSIAQAFSNVLRTQSINVANHFLGTVGWCSEVASIELIQVFEGPPFRVTYAAAVLLRFPGQQLVDGTAFSDEQLIIVGTGRACGYASTGEQAAKMAAKVCVTNAFKNAFKKFSLLVSSNDDGDLKVAVMSSEFIAESDQVELVVDDDGHIAADDDDDD